MLILKNLICLGLLLWGGLFSNLYALNNSPYNVYQHFLNQNLSSEQRYKALTKIQSRVEECKKFERDVEFYLRFGCFENYVLYTNPKNINVNFIKSYLTDDSFVIRSLAWKVLVELQINDLEVVAWLVIEDPRNFYKGRPLGNVDTALKVLKKDKAIKQKLLSLRKLYPQISQLSSFQYLL